MNSNKKTDQEEIYMDERIVKYQEKMDKTLANLDSEFGTIRAGRANPHVLDRIMVEYYGAPTPLQQVANISVPEARMIQIQPWEGKLRKYQTNDFTIVSRIDSQI